MNLNDINPTDWIDVKNHSRMIVLLHNGSQCVAVDIDAEELAEQSLLDVVLKAAETKAG